MSKYRVTRIAEVEADNILDAIEKSKPTHTTNKLIVEFLEE